MMLSTLSNCPEPTGNPANLQPLDFETLLRRIIYRIRQSLDLEVILSTTAQEIQQFLGTDRVMIYQFHADQSGQVVAEHCASGGPLPSLKGLNFPADDIPPATRQLFVEARVRNIVDVESGVIGQSRLRNPETGAALAEDWVYRPLDPCHGEYLTAMGVKASVVSPIFHGDHLWGLLVGHHADPLELPLQKMEALQLIMGQLSTAIAQSALLADAQAHSQREATISHITTLLHGSSSIELESALASTVEALQGTGGRLFIPKGMVSSSPKTTGAGQVYTYGNTPQSSTLIQPPELIHGVQAHLQNTAFAPWAIHDVLTVSSLRTLQLAFQQAELRSWLLVPLRVHQQVVAYLSVFRPARDTETLWAGRFDPNGRQDFPRQSFEIWRQTQRGQVYPWTTTDAQLAATLGAQFAIAIEQQGLYQHITTLNNTLEQQVHARTADLQQTLAELQKTQTQLIHTEKMSSLGQLVAGIAHEINNPINFIYGNMAHLQEYAEAMLALLTLYETHFPTTPEEIAKQRQRLDFEFIAQDLPRILESMQIGTTRIRQIVQSLQNFSRLDQAAVKRVDIHEGLDSTLMILHHRLKSTHDQTEIQVIKQYGDLPPVACFASQLNQVFMNLLANAIDALEEMDDRPPIITLRTQQEDPHTVTIQVTDNGEGVSPTVQKHIFDPFFTTKPVGKGTGLGLSISHEIVVRKHGGTLVCTPAHPQGTTFTITLPVERGEVPVL
ncbi:MAG: GAF domain-containing protein [Cyanobacteria bacterium]|nr:GAF domain-containing protein [Cyanobacteriota bacterium]